MAASSPAPGADESTVTERVRDAIISGDPAALPQLLSEVHALERLAYGRTVHVATNGKFPRWSIERWLAVATACMAGVVSVIVWIFAAGGEWRATREGVQELNRKMESLFQFQRATEQRLWELNQKIDANDRADEADRSGRATPVFPRDEALIIRGRGRGGRP